MNKHLERQKLLNRLAYAEERSRKELVNEEEANSRRIGWENEAKRLNALLAADEEDPISK